MGESEDMLENDHTRHELAERDHMIAGANHTLVLCPSFMLLDRCSFLCHALSTSPQFPLAGLCAEESRLAAEVDRLTVMLARETGSRDGLVREIKNRDLAIRDLRSKVMRFNGV